MVSTRPETYRMIQRISAQGLCTYEGMQGRIDNELFDSWLEHFHRTGSIGIVRGSKQSDGSWVITYPIHQLTHEGNEDEHP